MSAVSLFLGILAKENTITFLVIVPLTVAVFTKVPTSRSIAAGVPLFIATLLFILVRYKALGYMLNHGQVNTDIMNDPFLEMTGSERLATIFLTTPNIFDVFVNFSDKRCINFSKRCLPPCSFRSKSKQFALKVNNFKKYPAKNFKNLLPDL